MILQLLYQLLLLKDMNLIMSLKTWSMDVQEKLWSIVDLAN